MNLAQILNQYLKEPTYSALETLVAVVIKSYGC